jgi:hypothetical protein
VIVVIVDPLPAAPAFAAFLKTFLHGMNICSALWQS